MDCTTLMPDMRSLISKEHRRNIQERWDGDGDLEDAGVFGMTEAHVSGQYVVKVKGRRRVAGGETDRQRQTNR